jgi:uncharacterized membrane protein
MQTLPAEQQQQIIAAIKQAELATSGEIRVHIEGPCPNGDPVARAVAVFEHLGMHKTREQNGVLFYLALDDRKFAVIGDKGIDTRVPTDFWDSTKDLLRQHFAEGRYAEGLAQGIARAGEQLQAYFPRLADDTNELSDDISFS